MTFLIRIKEPAVGDVLGNFENDITVRVSPIRLTELDAHNFSGVSVGYSGPPKFPQEIRKHCRMWY